MPDNGTFAADPYEPEALGDPRSTDTRVRIPARPRAADARPKAPLVPADGRLMIIACDHPARGANGVGDQPLAMANRTDLLDRLQTALARPGVDGLLGSPDIIEDLLLLGALEGKVVFGSMNRGGLQGACFELDDRFTGYDAQAIADMGLNGGKTLTRVALDDPGTLNTLTGTADAINELAARGLVADGRAVLVLPRRRQGPQRPVGRRGHQIRRRLQRAGSDVGLHLDETPRGSGHGTRHGIDHLPDSAARRGPGHQPGGNLRELAGSAAAAGGSRPRRRPHPAVPRRRRRRRRSGHRRRQIR